MATHGSGVADGALASVSSTRGGLQGQTAMAIISNILLKAHDGKSTRTVLYGDNRGVQTTCLHAPTDWLKHHKQPNIDLKIEIQHASRDRRISTAWIKGRQDEDKPWTTVDDLKKMKLSNIAIMNTWCDKIANDARKVHITHPAVYSQTKSGLCLTPLLLYKRLQEISTSP